MAATPLTAEDRLAGLGLHLPDPPAPFGAYVPAVLVLGSASLPLGSPVELELILEVKL
jgi:hypothetical protein